jgi:hypothetical protein
MKNQTNKRDFHFSVPARYLINTALTAVFLVVCSS